MKQGKATHSGTGSTKVEPKGHAVPPAYAASLGSMRGNHSERGTTKLQTIPMYEGRGLQAPMKSTTIHNKGSQGKH